MSIIKKRPTISLRVPRDVRTGADLDVEVVLDVTKPIAVEWLHVTLVGTEMTRFGSGNSQATYRHTLLEQRAEGMRDEKLPVGRHPRTVRFSLEAGLPPSTMERQVSRARVDYSLQVRASIPWWPDAKADFGIIVQKPDVGHVDVPVRAATRVGGAVGDNPYLEMSLDASTYHPDDVIQGRVALFNVAANDYKAVEVSLRAMVEKRRKAFNGAVREKDVSRGPAWIIRLPCEGWSEGEAVPFQMRLPSVLTSSYESVLTGRSWLMEALAKTSLLRPNASLRVAIAIAPPLTASSPRRRRQAPPYIGSDLMREAWLRVAEALPLLRSEPDGGLRGRVGDVDISIGRKLRGADGTFVTADLRYPSLHLDLDGGLTSGFRRLLGGGVKLGDASWDQRHYLSGREPAQVEAFATALRETLRQAELADISDETICLQIQDSGLRHAPVKRLATLAIAIAEHLPAAREAIPPPEALAHAVPAWRRLATRLDGVLEPARMAIQGRWHGQGVEVTTEYSAKGEILHTAVALQSSARFDAEHQISWSRGEMVHGDLERLSKRARALFAQTKKGAVALRIEPARLTLWLEGPVADPKPIPRRLMQLEKLASALMHRSGPYR